MTRNRPNSSAPYGERGIRLTERTKKNGGFAYSLKSGLILMIVAGAVIATGAFLLVHFGATHIVNRFYLTDAKRSEREISAIISLQQHVTKEGIGSENISRVDEWQTRHRYVYILIYNADGKVIYASDRGPDTHYPAKPTPNAGITVEFPKEEELRHYAESNSPYPLYIADGTLTCSAVDFTEYLYYDMSNIISLVTALVTLAVLMIVYQHRLTVRLTRLAEDVSQVAEGDMNHTIFADDSRDEITTLEENVENMRQSLLSTLENERKAVSANNELITSMSHDIRTPLTVLLGYLDVMKMNTEDETMRGYISSAESTANRLKELSDDMFRYFIVYADHDPEMTLTDCDAETLLDQMLGEHVFLLREHGYDISWDGYPFGTPARTVRTDVQKLMRIIDNLFSNVSKYADKDAPVRLDISFEKENICLQIVNKISPAAERVDSNGVGLRTCARLSHILGADLSLTEKNGNFIARLSLPSTLS